MLFWFLAGIAVFLIHHFLVKKKEPEILEHDAIVFQSFTPQTLAKYNGRDDPRILMAIKGKVYDVTAGKANYGPGGMYENFAGRDASRGLAKHSFEKDLLTPLDAPVDDLKDLNAEENAALEQWIEFFSGKYPLCGDFVDKN